MYRYNYNKTNSSLYRDRETNLSTYNQGRHFSKHFPITGKRH